ncbi:MULTISPECIES: hypothetical protein [unclassified Serratia (in: enterobacteria)]|uniref:hypothetical protein n=1 Tax=unclassified Serratia (in: enterobacteria) TaxID=2647522 RepID=UPI003B42A015
MTKEQLELIVALFAAQQAATVHLSMLVAQNNGIEKENMADSFRKTAELLGDHVPNKEIISLVLNQIAYGISTSAVESQKVIEKQIKELLH